MDNEKKQAFNLKYAIEDFVDDHRKLAIGGAIGIGLLLIVLLIAVFWPKKPGLSLAQYVVPQYQGIDREATATAELDLDKIINDFYVEPANRPSEDDDASSAIPKTAADFAKERDLLEKGLRCEVLNEKPLSNGDDLGIVIRFDANIMAQLGIDYEGEQCVLKVEGLPENRILDPFADIQLLSTGVSPYLTLSIANKSKDPVLQDAVKYSIDTHGKEYVAEGDKVIVSITYNEKELQEARCIIEETSKEYTISNASSYLNGSAKLEGANRDALYNQATDNMDAGIADVKPSAAANLFMTDREAASKAALFTASTYTLEKAILLSAKTSEAVGNARFYNRMVFLFSFDAGIVDTAMNSLYSGKAYAATTIDNIIMNADGTISYDLMSSRWYGPRTGTEDLMNELVNTYKSTFSSSDYTNSFNGFQLPGATGTQQPADVGAPSTQTPEDAPAEPPAA